MTNPAQDTEDEISLLAAGTTLLRNWRRLVVGTFVGAVVAVLPIAFNPPVYPASASFFPQGSDGGRSGLANLAGQFGVSIPGGGGNQTLSPDFYQKLLKTRVLLLPIVRDSFVVAEEGNRKAAFLDLFEVPGGSVESREQDGVQMLADMMPVSVQKTTSVVELSVATKWPSVSLAIATAVVNGINSYNQKTRQGQAAAERKFVEGRVAEARDSLRAAEDRLERFSKSNVLIESSPTLRLEGDRLSRDAIQKQQLTSALVQAYEDVRIREVRDTPVITMLETPTVSTTPLARGRIKRALLGFAIGGFLMAVFALATGAMSKTPRGANAEADEFFSTLRETRDDVLRLARLKPRGGTSKA